jgi:hypothetical protein
MSLCVENRNWNIKLLIVLWILKWNLIQPISWLVYVMLLFCCIMLLTVKFNYHHSLSYNWPPQELWKPENSTIYIYILLLLSKMRWEKLLNEFQTSSLQTTSRDNDDDDDDIITSFRIFCTIILCDISLNEFCPWKQVN